MTETGTPAIIETDITNSASEFSDLISNNQNLTFKYFTGLWNQNNPDQSVQTLMMALGFYKPGTGFTRSAELVSDQNRFPGLSIVRHSQIDGIILERHALAGCSILEQFDEALEILTRIYTYEDINGAHRVFKNRIPPEAIRISLADAIAYRDWSKPDLIEIEAFEDRLTISVPGGVPSEMTDDEYLHGSRSIPRNTNLAMALIRLKLLDGLGTGTKKIISLYSGTGFYPQFEFSDHSCRITLPVTDSPLELSERERFIFDKILSEGTMRRTEIMDLAGLTRSTATRILNHLIDLKLIVRTGSGPSYAYQPTSAYRSRD